MVHVQIIWHIVQENDSTKCRTFHSLTGWLFVTSPARPIVAKKWFNQNNMQDLHMVELEDFKYGGTNITALRLVDPANEKVYFGSQITSSSW